MKKRYKKWLALLLSVTMVMMSGVLSTAPGLLAADVQPYDSTESTDSAAGDTSEVKEEVAMPDSPSAEATEPAAETTASATETAPVPSSDNAEPSVKSEAPAEPAAEEDATVAMPEQNFSGKADNGVTVKVHAPEGAFPEGTFMKVTAVRAATAKKIAEEAQDNVSDAVGVDITFFDKNKTEIQPQKAVSVSMSLADELKGDDFAVVHKPDGGAAETVTQNASADGANFQGDQFSIYVIVSETDPAIATYKFHETDEADSAVISEQSIKGDEKLVAPETPSKDGSKFLGWATTAGASEADFDLNVGTVTETKTVDLYPVFQNVHYVFFMDSSDADTCRVFQTKEGASGAEITTADVKISLDSRHAVTGWYTSPSLQPSTKVDKVTLKNENVKLYPKIEEGHYITFDCGEGASFIDPEFVAAGQNSVKPADPKRAGYTFNSWKTPDNTTYRFNRPLTEDLHLTASWTGNTNVKYTVIHWQQNANDDKYSFAEAESKSGTAGAQTAASAKTYQGFKLKEAVKQETIKGDGSTIVNVYYDRNEYSVKFYKYIRSTTVTEYYTETGWYDIFGRCHDSNNGFRTYHEAGEVKGSHEETVNDWKELEEHRITARYGADIADKWPSEVAQSWGVNHGRRSGTEPYQSGISTMPLNGAEFYYIVEEGSNAFDTNFYLEKLDADGNDQYFLDHTDRMIYDESLVTTQEDHYAIKGFTYSGNVPDRSRFTYVGYDSATGLYVYKVDFKYYRNSYDIKFINGGSSSTKTFKYQANIADAGFTPSRPTGIPAEYKFVGWFDNEGGYGEPYDFTGKTMPAGNMTLYAKWAAPVNSGKAYLTVDGGEGVNFQVEYGSKIDPSMLPTVKDSEGNILSQGTSQTITVPANNAWVGWATKDGDSFITFNFDTNITSDIELYPYYISTEKYTVTYYDNKGGDEQTVTDGKKYAKTAYADIQSAEALTPPEGKVFFNWNTKADGSGKAYYPGDKIHVTGNMSLYAQYGDKTKVTSLTYKANYPADAGMTEEQSADQVDNLLPNNKKITLNGNKFAEPEDYEFVCWNTKADGSGASYEAGQKIGVDTTNDAAENILYAQWKEKQRELTITAIDYDKQYDAKSHEGGIKSATAGGAEVDLTNATIKYKYGDSDEWVTTPPSVKAVTAEPLTYTVKVTMKGYAAATAEGSLNVKPKEVTVTGKDDSKVYGENDPAKFEATVEGLLGSDTVDYTVSREAGENVGTYDVIPTGDEIQGNYKVTYANGTFTITQAEVTVTGADNSKVYGAIDPALTATVSGLKKGDDASVITYNVSREAGENVGHYAINPTGEAQQGNYKVTYVAGDFEITRKAVTVTVDNKTKTYGDADPKFTANVSGLKEGDLISSINYTMSREEGEDAGSYQITATGDAEQGNYTVSFVPGTLTINKKAVTVTADHKTKVFGTDDPDLTATVGDLVGEDTIDYTLSRTPGEAVGDYDITPTGDAEQGNYTVTFVKNTLTITEDPQEVVINIKGDRQTKDYNGSEQVASGYTVEIPEGIEITANEISTTGSTVVRKTNAGSYDMGLKADTFSCSNKNYSNVKFNIAEDGNLTINKIQATVKANDDQKNFGDEDPKAFTATVTGLVDGDTLDYSVAREPGEKAGTYDIIPTGDATQGNYDVEYQNGTFTINASSENVIIKIKGHQKTEDYDGTNKTVSGYDVEIPSGVSITKEQIAKEGAASITEKNAGTYTMNLSAEDFSYTGGDYSNVTFQIEQDGQLVINRAKATVTAKDGSKVFGTADPASFEATVSGLKGSDTLSYTVGREAGEDAGTYKITPVGDDVQGNYDVTYETGTFTIEADSNEVLITITGKSKTVDYSGSEESVNGYDLDIPYGIQIDDIQISYQGAAVAKGTNAGTYNMGLDAGKFSCSNDNYSNVKFQLAEDGKLTINKVIATVQAKDKNKTYGATDPEFEATVKGLKGNDKASMLNYTISRKPGEDVGQYDIIPSGDDVQGNYNVVYQNGTLTIDPDNQKVVIKVTGNHRSGAYTGLEQKAEGYDVEIPSGIDITKKQIKHEGEAVASRTNVGKTNMELAAKDFSSTNGNYSNVEFQIAEDGYVEVTPAAVTVNAEPKSKTFGAADPELTATVSGMVNGEKAEDLISYSLSRAPGEQVGTYDITPSGEASQGNYNVTFNKSTLTINADATEVVIKITGNTGGKAYTGKEQTVSGYEIEIPEGIKINENQIAYDGNASVSGTNAGQYPMGLDKSKFSCSNDNYSNVKFEVTDGKLNIARADAVVKPEDKSKTYGATDPALTAVVSGLVNNESDSLISYELSREAGENAGTYKITASGDAVQGNYNVTYQQGRFSINSSTEKVVIKVTGNHAGGSYTGQPQTATGYTVKIPDGIDITEDQIEYDGDATATRTNVGKTNMNLDPLDFDWENDNYRNVSFEIEADGYVDITPASVVVNAEPKSKTFGAEDPELTATVSGMVNDESEDLISYTLSRAEGENVGTYDITPAGDAVQGNYNVTFNKSALTINADATEVVIKITGKTGGETYTGKQQTVSGYEIEIPEGVKISKDQIAYDGTASVSGTNAGKYPMGLDKNKFSTNNDNYSNVKYDVTDGSLNIDRAEATVTADNKNSVYGQPIPELTATVSGLKNGEPDSTISYKLTREPGTNAGHYVITPSGEEIQGNYHVTFVQDALDIAKAADNVLELEVTAKDNSKVYDGEAITATATVRDDESGNTTFTYKYIKDGEEITSDTPPSRTEVGRTKFTVIASNPNFEIASKEAVLEVTPAPVTVTANDASKVVGEEDPELTATVAGMVNGEDPSLIKYDVTRAPGEEIADYKITPEGAPVQGNYSVTYYPGTFHIAAEETYQLTVHFVDTAGNQLAPDFVQRFPEGAAVTVDSPLVAGYTAREASYTIASMPAEDTVHTVIYDANVQPAPGPGPAPVPAPNPPAIVPAPIAAPALVAGAVIQTPAGTQPLQQEEEVKTAKGLKDLFDLDNALPFTFMLMTILVLIAYSRSMKKNQEEVQDLTERLNQLQ